jgi:hypothetical protein
MKKSKNDIDKFSNMKIYRYHLQIRTKLFILICRDTVQKTE